MSKKNRKNAAVSGDLELLSSRYEKGLTVSQIRYQRALVALQKDLCKERLNNSVTNLKNSNPFSSKSGTGSLLKSGLSAVAKGTFSGANFVDIAIVGFSVIKNVTKIVSFFSKKKK